MMVFYCPICGGGLGPEPEQKVIVSDNQMTVLRCSNPVCRSEWTFIVDFYGRLITILRKDVRR